MRKQLWLGFLRTRAGACSSLECLGTVLWCKHGGLIMFPGVAPHVSVLCKNAGNPVVLTKGHPSHAGCITYATGEVSLAHFKKVEVHYTVAAQAHVGARSSAGVVCVCDVASCVRCLCPLPLFTSGLQCVPMCPSYSVHHVSPVLSPSCP